MGERAWAVPGHAQQIGAASGALHGGGAQLAQHELVTGGPALFDVHGCLKGVCMLELQRRGAA